LRNKTMNRLLSLPAFFLVLFLGSFYCTTYVVYFDEA
jgi:hypothetical protein